MKNENRTNQNKIANVINELFENVPVEELNNHLNTLLENFAAYGPVSPLDKANAISINYKLYSALNKLSELNRNCCENCFVSILPLNII